MDVVIFLCGSLCCKAIYLSPLHYLVCDNVNWIVIFFVHAIYWRLEVNHGN